MPCQSLELANNYKKNSNPVITNNFIILFAQQFCLEVRAWSKHYLG